MKFLERLVISYHILVHGLPEMPEEEPKCSCENNKAFAEDDTEHHDPESDELEEKYLRFENCRWLRVVYRCQRPNGDATHPPTCDHECPFVIQEDMRAEYRKEENWDRFYQ